MHALYDQLADWWPLFSAPEDYAEEAAYAVALIFEMMSSGEPLTLLELGSGGGNNASHMKQAFASVTLVDLSPRMLNVSRKLNPDCQHVQGDMRSIRLGRQFDVVFVHDAVDYMTNEDDLRRAIETIAIHCRPGGMALILPDYVKETFAPSTDHGGEDGDGRSIRYLEWTTDPDPDDTTYTTDYVIITRADSQPAAVTYDLHTGGLFPRATWLRLLDGAGFETSWEIDPYQRCVFSARTRPE